MKEHYDRWHKHFGNEPWWDMYCALYEGPGHDWEGASEALDQMAYALAKARGIDTTQTCPKCKTVVDEVHTLTQWRHCAACEAAEEARWAEERRQADEAKAQHEAWLASLPPKERERYLEEQRREMMMTLGGLWKRDVQ